MDVFVDSLGSPSFSIEVDFWDTVLTIKQKIEKSQGVPVSKQIIFFKGKVLQNHFDITESQIIPNCHLKLFMSPDDNPNQNIGQVTQTEQRSSSSSSASINPIEEFAKATQSWPLMAGSNNDQALQTEETQVSLNSSGNELLGIQGKNEHQVLLQPEQSDSVTVQDSSVMMRSNYNESQTLREIERLLDLEDKYPPVMVGSSSNMNQVGMPSASDKGKEIIEIPDSPVKKKIKTSTPNMIVMVKLIKENWSIPMEVNADDNVGELRKVLEKMEEKGQIYLPRVDKIGYFFMRRNGGLCEDQSFQENHIADGETIDILEGSFKPKAE